MFSALYKDELERTNQLLSGYELAPTKDGASELGKETSLELVLYAGLGFKELRTILMRMLVVCAILVGLALITQIKFFILLTVGVPIFEYGRLRTRAFRRAEAFEHDYTALLLSLASAVRTGMDPLEALCGVGRLFQKGSPVRSEVKRFSENIERGLTEEQAMARFGIGIYHPDLPLFRTAYILSRQKGSGLSECLQRLARVTRQRQSFRRKVRAALAMQKLSAFGIAACAIIIGAIQFVSNPKAIFGALEHPLGYRLLLFGSVLIVIGLGWMINLSRSRI